MGYLPEPTDGGPNDFASTAVAANSAGTIVGSADIVDPLVVGGRRSVPVRWTRQNGSYQYQFLPIPPDELWGTVNAINEAGIMVGATNNDALQIHDLGEVVGRLNDEIAGGGPYPQGGWGYFWDGVSNQVELLRNNGGSLKTPAKSAEKALFFDALALVSGPFPRLPTSALSGSLPLVGRVGEGVVLDAYVEHELVPIPERCSAAPARSRLSTPDSESRSSGILASPIRWCEKPTTSTS